MFRFDFRSREYGGKLILIDSFNLANLCASEYIWIPGDQSDETSCVQNRSQIFKQ